MRKRPSKNINKLTRNRNISNHKILEKDKLTKNNNKQISTLKARGRELWKINVGVERWTNNARQEYFKQVNGN